MAADVITAEPEEQERKPATFCFLICLLLLQDLHAPSTITWTVGAALVSAFATTHPEAAGLPRV